MSKMAGLAMSAEDHLSIGSTPMKELRDNPGKKWHELMDDQRLRNFIADQVMVVTAQHRKARKGDPREVQLFRLILDSYLAPNLAYLKEIGRLPDELQELDPATDFPLPDSSGDEKTGFYYLTALYRGQVINSCDGPSGWNYNDVISPSSFHDAKGVAHALDCAAGLGLLSVRVHHVVIGTELSGDEIRQLRLELETKDK
jgi:hypothetical protein